MLTSATFMEIFKALVISTVVQGGSTFTTVSIFKKKFVIEENTEVRIVTKQFFQV